MLGGRGRLICKRYIHCIVFKALWGKQNIQQLSKQIPARVCVDADGPIISAHTHSYSTAQGFILLWVIAVSASFEVLLMNLKRGHTGIDG